jgi:hypothetical protein
MIKSLKGLIEKLMTKRIKCQNSEQTSSACQAAKMGEHIILKTFKNYIFKNLKNGVKPLPDV